MFGNSDILIYVKRATELVLTTVYSPFRRGRRNHPLPAIRVACAGDGIRTRSATFRVSCLDRLATPALAGSGSPLDQWEPLRILRPDMSWATDSHTPNLGSYPRRSPPNPRGYPHPLWTTEPLMAFCLCQPFRE